MLTLIIAFAAGAVVAVTVPKVYAFVAKQVSSVKTDASAEVAKVEKKV